jgi:hypothetical protein
MTSSSLPAVLHRLVDDELYDRGVLSVKFRVLHGRVVFFRPFVRRRTAATSAASRYVDRVIFVVATTGELVIADADALPKRSVPLKHVTTILLDAAASTVALMFESSAAEHDVQLVFGAYPPGLGTDSAQLNSSTSRAHMNTPGSSSSRVTFSDRTTVVQREDDNMQSGSSSIPLMTLKQFIHTVLAFAPAAQVIQGTVASMELKLAKPKFFADPTASVASVMAQPPAAASRTLPSTEVGDLMTPAHRPPDVSDKTTTLVASPIAAEEHEASAMLDAPATSGVGARESGGEGKTFRDLYPVASWPSNGRSRVGDDSDASFATDFAPSATGGPQPTAPPPSTPSPTRQSLERRDELSSIVHPRQSLRDIVASGSFHSKKKTPLLPSTGQDDSLQQFQSLEPPYDRPQVLHTDADGDDLDADDDARSSSAVDTASALRRFSLLHRKANEWNDGDGSASRTSRGGHGGGGGGDAALDDDDHVGGGFTNDNQNPNDPPLLSDMVRKLRGRRGEIQMQNLMMDGEIKGLQQRIDAILASYQRVNPLPELEDYPVHHHRAARGQTQQPRHYDAAEYTAEGDDEDYHTSLLGATDDHDDDQPKLMSATKEYNRALNLSLVLLNICRRQRQIHLHAEYDARERWRAMQRRGGGYPTAASLSDGSSTYGLMSAASVPFQGNVFMGPDAALMLRSSYSEGSRTMDMQRLISMGF